MKNAEFHLATSHPFAPSASLYTTEISVVSHSFAHRMILHFPLLPTSQRLSKTLRCIGFETLRLFFQITLLPGWLSLDVSYLQGVAHRSLQMPLTLQPRSTSCVSSSLLHVTNSCIQQMKSIPTKCDLATKLSPTSSLALTPMRMLSEIEDVVRGARQLASSTLRTLPVVKSARLVQLQPPSSDFDKVVAK